MMGIFGAIGKMAGLDGLIAEIGDTVRQVLPNAQAQRDFDIQLAEIADRHAERISKEMQMQVDINKLEAGHESTFVAGWRPFIGWVCGFGIAWNFVASPLLQSLGVTQAGTLNIEYLITLVVTMLGASGIRTYEKKHGISLAQAPAPEATANAVAQFVPTSEAEENAPWNRK